MPRPKLPVLDFDGAVIARKDAKRLGLPRYFTGKACSVGHLAERYVNGSCVLCVRVRTVSAYHKDIDASRTKTREWSRLNRDKKLAWNVANKEKIAIATRAWWKANPQKKNAHRRNRIARVMLAPGKHTAEDVTLLLKQQKYRCIECRKSIKREAWEVDHIMPLVKGGSNDRYNLQILCQRCNRRKGGSDPIQHAHFAGRLL